MDFVEALPKVGGKSVILTVVDRFSKYAHFIPLGHPYTAESVARVFFAKVVRLHVIPASIVSDRDPVFTSAFWKALFSASSSKLHMSSAFHPQIEQGDWHVPQMHDRRPYSAVGSLASLGGVHLQYNLSPSSKIHCLEWCRAGTLHACALMILVRSGLPPLLKTWLNMTLLSKTYICAWNKLRRSPRPRMITLIGCFHLMLEIGFDFIYITGRMVL